MARLLVIDGNQAEIRAKHKSVGGTDSGDGYAATLKRLQPDLDVDIVRPADEEPKLPAGVSLADYDGVAISGSALNIYSREVAVERQIELAKAVFAAGVPCFGSCWGLQLGVTAAGGTVIRNPRGREFGFGRRIMLNAQGRDHAMFQGKPEVFEAVTVHVDTVDSLPPGGVPLAHNDMGLQAAEIRFTNGGSFWGVQYHPEYS
ncbi:MAG TPA: type 1 glutamine amidotransferase, partial [Steroidobacteraceae bacterium]